jgi:lipopolysaccharide transport system permease protein
MSAAEVPSQSPSTLPPVDDEKITLIEPLQGWVHLGLREMWDYRELLFFFTWRDIKVRYKQTILGASWAVLQPFFSMVVFSIFFGQLAKIPSDGIPYPIFSYTGLLPWTFFANGLTSAANSVVRDANLVKKVYFPRLVVPVSSVLGGLLDFVLALLVLVGMMVYYGLYPTVTSIVWLPFFLLLALTTALASGLWLSAMNAQYRDIRYVVPFLAQVWMWVTPVVYPASLLDQPWRTLYGLNPMVGVVEGFRWVLLGAGHAPGLMVVLSSLVAAGMFVSGAFYFRRMERTFADVV